MLSIDCPAGLDRNGLSVFAPPDNESFTAAPGVGLPGGDPLLERLAARLKQPLPGPRAQARYQPELSYGRYFGPTPGGARAAAVIILLYPGDTPRAGQSNWCVPLTLRPDHLLDHAGQISLPGGAIEPQESSQRAALRELNEELGVGPEGIELLGELSPIYLFRSNFLIQPWLAASRVLPDWHPNSAEVAELLEVPLDTLCRPASTRVDQHRQGSLSFRAPALVWRQHAIWGATALILAELVALVEEIAAAPGR
jgi:8-oxo-dGTP pyrophosphatase MutT (NUDIX family)